MHGGAAAALQLQQARHLCPASRPNERTQGKLQLLIRQLQGRLRLGADSWPCFSCSKRVIALPAGHMNTRRVRHSHVSVSFIVSVWCVSFSGSLHSGAAAALQLQQARHCTASGAHERTQVEAGLFHFRSYYQFYFKWQWLVCCWQ
jgi:hypothetical protein